MKSIGKKGHELFLGLNPLFLTLVIFVFMRYSYWETKTWLQGIDFAIIGSGIVGLCCALELRKLHPKAKIVLFEKGRLPQGASTKNAGFACFGSLTELLDDLNHHHPEEIYHLVQKRFEGLKLLRSLLGDKALDLKTYGGYELFPKKDKEYFERATQKIAEINQLLSPLFQADVFALQPTPYGFNNVHDQIVFNRFEAQIDTGKMMQALLQKAIAADIRVLNNVALNHYTERNDGVALDFGDFTTHCSQLFLATNGFSNALLDTQALAPARAQVLITEPIENLAIKGCFHLDRGYYYFRNIDNRILLGGGRNLDIKGEQTTDFGLNLRIQRELEHLLHTVILPNREVNIAQRWSGIMGMGQQKTAIVKTTEKNIHCGIRLGGMGVAIGSSIGKALAQLAR